jgi:hypothetical protein
MSEAQIREVLVSQGGQDVNIEEALEGSAIGRAGEADEFLEAEGMRIGTCGEERVAGLENKWEPGEGQGKL